MKPSSLAARYVVAASTFAAAALVSAASADVTFTFTNQVWTGFNFTEAFAAGTLTGTLTGATVNATLNASTNYTYADDLCIYVAPSPLALGGLLQCGGFSNLNAGQRYSWANGASDAPGTPVSGTVNFTTGINMAANPTQSIWIGNGYGAAGTSGTWTGTITLLGVTAVPAPGAVALLGLAGFCSRRRRA
jgi:MYXO-CTERM domain-containing protein